MSRPLLHLFGKLVYNGWAISLGGAASNIAYEKGFPCHHCMLVHSYLSEIWSALGFIRGRAGIVLKRREKSCGGHCNPSHGPQDYLDVLLLDIFGKSVPIRNFKNW